MKEDNRIFFEDALLTRGILYVISKCHDLEIEKIYRHVMVNGMEVDAVAICKTYEDRYERWVGFELKENALDKAMDQAMLRRDYFDYFYVVIDLSVASIVGNIIRGYFLDHIKNHKIGIISSYDDVVVAKSGFKARKEKDKKINGREIDKFQMKLIQFLEEHKKKFPQL